MRVNNLTDIAHNQNLKGDIRGIALLVALTATSTLERQVKLERNKFSKSLFYKTNKSIDVSISIKYLRCGHFQLQIEFDMQRTDRTPERTDRDRTIPGTT